MSKKKSHKNPRVLLGRLHGTDCFYCGAPEARTVDHVIPSSLGGSNTIGNKVLCCERCNNIKGSLLPEVFIARYPELIKPDFDLKRKERAEYDAYGIPCVCRVCGTAFYAVNQILRFCQKACTSKAREAHNRLFRESPIYARLLFSEGHEVPPYIYKEFA
jgi:hypothetical protein